MSDHASHAIDATQAVPLMPESPLYAAYFEGLRDGRLAVPQCRSCAGLQWPPREICGTCQGTEFASADMPTEGEVYTYSVMYRAFHPAFRDAVPYAVVVVELAKGVRLIGRWADDEPDSLTCGIRVTAVFDDLGTESGSVAWRRAG